MDFRSKFQVLEFETIISLVYEKSSSEEAECNSRLLSLILAQASQCCNATFQLEIRAVTRRGVHMIIRLAIKVRVAGINFGFLFRHSMGGRDQRRELFGIYEDQEPQACGHQITWCFFGSYRDPSHQANISYSGQKIISLTMYYRLACMLVGYCPTEIFWVGFTI